MYFLILSYADGSERILRFFRYLDAAKALDGYEKFDQLETAHILYGRLESLEKLISKNYVDWNHNER